MSIDMPVSRSDGLKKSTDLHNIPLHCVARTFASKTGESVASTNFCSQTILSLFFWIVVTTLRSSRLKAIKANQADRSHDLDSIFLIKQEIRIQAVQYSDSCPPMTSARV